MIFESDAPPAIIAMIGPGLRNILFEIGLWITIPGV
jgi:hypothetical protein